MSPYTVDYGGADDGDDDCDDDAADDDDDDDDDVDVCVVFAQLQQLL